MSISIANYIYFIFYITAMVAFFGLSLVMLLPRTRMAFKAPVPHVHAANLLLTTDYTIKQVQVESGFSIRTTFSKYFADYHRCSPRAYRQKK